MGEKSRQRKSVSDKKLDELNNTASGIASRLKAVSSVVSERGNLELNKLLLIGLRRIQANIEMAEQNLRKLTGASGDIQSILREDLDAAVLVEHEKSFKLSAEEFVAVRTVELITSDSIALRIQTAALPISKSEALESSVLHFQEVAEQIGQYMQKLEPAEY